MDNNAGSVNRQPVTLSAGLYLVATPIGNLRDITLRALDVLAAADMVVCEDTRVTGKLMQAYSLKKSLSIYNDHSNDDRRAGFLQMMGDGKSIALVSDAGTPLISDPGYKLVRDALEQGIMVTALPGANAPLTALQLSGLPSDAFSFAGFLPPKREARKRRLRDWLHTPGALIFFESAPRLVASLQDMAEIFGDRPAAVTRELTKMYEESRRGSLTFLAGHYDTAGPPKGEIVIVVGPGQAAENHDLTGLLEDALTEMSLRDAVLHVADLTGQPKKEVYALALTLAGARV